LQVVEGHALAQQGEIQLVAYLPLHFLRQQFCAEVAAQLQRAAYELRDANGQRQRQQDACIRNGFQHGVEGIAREHRHHGRECGIPDGADEHHEDDPTMPPGV
jgi:hypothetical protein